MLDRRQLLTGGVATAASTPVWWAALPRVLAPAASPVDGPLSPHARAMLDGLVHRWTEAGRPAFTQMRKTNPEWDFMGRTFFALSLVDAVLRGPEDAAALLDVLDQVVDDTLALAAAQPLTFLLPYGRHGGWVQKPARSVFIEGELALVETARAILTEDPTHRSQATRRLQALATRLDKTPHGMAESYPDECWMFCNSFARGALAVGTRLGWVDAPADTWARSLQAFQDPKTGMLVSSFRYRDNAVLDGPEGSSIYLTAHMLQLVDPALAADQYERARTHLNGSVLGFGYAKEWPDSWEGRHDIDSGATVPVLGASPSASGLAMLAASSFGDTDTLRSLTASLQLAAAPTAEGEGLRYAASNVVGDAVMTCALCAGPLWALWSPR